MGGGFLSQDLQIQQISRHKKAMWGDSSFGSGADLRAHKNGKNSFMAAHGQGIPDVPPWLFGHMPGCRSGPDPPGTQKNLVSLDSSIGRWGPSYLGEQPR